VQLYAGSAEEFANDILKGDLADKLTTAFEAYYYKPPTSSERESWVNSLQAVNGAIGLASLTDNEIVVEYELPYTNMRIDCLLFGKDNHDKGNVVLLELKQWSNVEDCQIENNVITWMGGARTMEPHPSYQVAGYHWYLLDFKAAFEEEPPLILSSVAYCHNYASGEKVLLDAKFSSMLREFPLFTKVDAHRLADYLKSRLGRGSGVAVFNRFSDSPVRPSKKLLEHTKRMIEGQRVFNLVGEQVTAYNTIIDRANKCTSSERKSVIIVRGGPGTGKSVIALNVIAELLSKGQAVYHATGSKAFTTTLRKIVQRRAANLFRYFNSFAGFERNQIPVLVCDEAHRIRRTRVGRFTPKELRTGRPQIDELIEAAKVSIFFIDDYQIVRPEEIGSSELIRNAAGRLADDVFEFELKTQFRCSGSDGYLNWLDNVLDIRSTANRMLTKREKMEFRIFDGPNKLYEEIKRKNSAEPNSARMVAGYCWPWSDPNPDGTLKEDVVIGDFRITWEAKNEARFLAPGIPRAALWAYDPNGVNQMGSIYTIQGFEFDYVGVVFGGDLVYDWELKSWIGKPDNSADAMVKRDRDRFTRNVKNAYRVLMTRGMKGCYVYFMDKGTERYFRSHIEGQDHETPVSA
jgi:uncharacterized protein